MPLTRFEECWPLPTESLCWTPLKPQHSIPCWLSVQWEPSACRSCQFCQKRNHQKFVAGFALSHLLGSRRASMLPLGTLSLDLWVIAVDPAFIAGHQSIKNCRIWIDQLDHLPAVMTTSFFLIFSEHPWDKLQANLLHLQFLMNNCVYSSHTDIKLCTYCLYRHTNKILYLANQLWCSDFLTPPTPLIIPQTPCLPWISYATQKLMLDSYKMLQKHSICFCGIFSKFKTILLHIILLKYPHVQIAFLKFTSCNNQALVGCIPIAAVAVHLNLKCLYKKVWKLIVGNMDRKLILEISLLFFNTENRKRNFLFYFIFIFSFILE